MQYPFIGAKHHGGTQNTKSLHRIVMHSTVTPCEAGEARTVAGWFHTWDKEASAHYVVGPDGIVKCLHDNQIAWHAPPNTGSIGIEQTDSSNHKDSSVWLKGDHLKMLKLSAQLVAAKCKAYDIPVVWLSVADLKAGKRGITSHLNVSNTWHQTTHTDPGKFPATKFIAMVKAEMGTPTKPPTDKKVVIDQVLRNTHPMMHGDDVKAVQGKVGASTDGWFGPNTDTHVRAFQRAKKLKIDGIVGPKTVKALGFTWKG